MLDIFQLFAVNKEITRTALIHYKNVNEYVKFTKLQLEQETEKIYNCIRKQNELTNQVIGVLLESNILLAPIVLAISKCGCSFICLDLENHTRNRYLIQHLGIVLLFCTVGIKQDVYEYETVEELTIFNSSLKLSKLSTELLQHENNISYVVCTSGTTGEPKLVKVTNECIMQNIESFRSIFKISSDDVLLLNTPTTFDPFIIELYICLMSNAALIVLDNPPQLTKQHRNVFEQLFTKTDDLPGITILQIPPSVFLNFGPDYIENIICHKNSSLRVLALGGEQFSNINFISNLMRNNQNLQIFNLYGITEVSCWASVHEIFGNYDENDVVYKYGVPLGKPLSGTGLQVINEDGVNVEHGDGELLIECTNRICHIPTENPIILNNKSYRPTGDIVRVDIKTKNIFYMGRKNRVFKKFGHKISLDQIEISVSHFISTPCACLWDNSTKRLIIFITQHLSLIQKKQIREHVLKNVSKGAVLDQIHFIDKLPLTKHGKINRDELLRLSSENNCQFTLSELFQNIICEILSITDFERSFYDLGGTSIIAMEIANKFEQITEHNLPLEIFDQILNSKMSLNDVFHNFNSFNTISNQYSVNQCKKRKLNNEFVLLNDKTDLDSVQLFMKVRWKHNMEACVDASPSVCRYEDNTLVIIGAHSHKLAIINFKSGEIIYETKLNNRIEGTTSCFGKYVFVGCYSGFIYCINIVLKIIKWKYKTDSRVKATPILCKENTSIVVGSYDNKLHCINIETGNVEWLTPLLGSISSHVLLRDHRVFVATIQGNCYCLNENNGEIIWTQSVGTPIFGSSTFFQNSTDKIMIIYPDVKGVIHCLSSDDGLKVWEYHADDAVYSSVIVNKNKIYFGCHDNCLYELEILNDTCLLKSKYKFESPIFASPCIINNLFEIYHDLVVCSTKNGNIYICDLNKKILLSKIQLDGEIFSTPVIFENNILLGCRNDFVYCFEVIKK